MGGIFGKANEISIKTWEDGRIEREEKQEKQTGSLGTEPLRRKFYENMAGFEEKQALRSDGTFTTEALPP